jgi:hypothetical protein
MASPREIIERWDARLKREAEAAAAKKTVANDNDVPAPDGAVLVDGQPMAYWLPPGALLYTPRRKRKREIA